MLWPKRGHKIIGNDLILDIYGRNFGYLYVTTKSDSKSKIMVERDQYKLPYDIKGNGFYDLIPLNMGDGIYKVTLYRNVTGNKYRPIDSQWVAVKQNRPDACFYIPNQYVNYSPSSEAVNVAKSLWKGNKRQYFEDVKEYIRLNYRYDFIKAIKKPTNLPEIDRTVETHSGICQDLAALFVALMRLRDIKSKLVIGYADKQYHAWTLTTIEGKEILFDPTYAVNSIGRVKHYRNERIY